MITAEPVEIGTSRCHGACVLGLYLGLSDWLWPAIDVVRPKVLSRSREGDGAVEKLGGQRSWH